MISIEDALKKAKALTPYGIELDGETAIDFVFRYKDEEIADDPIAVNKETGEAYLWFYPDHADEPYTEYRG